MSQPFVSSKKDTLYICKPKVIDKSTYIKRKFIALYELLHPLLLFVSSLILSFILATDFGCILSLHSPLYYQKLYPRYLTLLICSTQVFSLFTLRNSLPSIYGVILRKVLSALFLLLQNIIQSSAYLTYLCPLRTNSLSSSL